MTLREELAKRIGQLWIADAEDWAKDSSAPRIETATFLLAVADECIRFAEWNRRRPLGDQDLKALALGPLTLAPEDWKP